MSKLVNIAMFTAGAAIGSVVAWNLLKAKYERIANEEIESVREIYEKKKAANAKDVEEAIVRFDESTKKMAKETEAFRKLKNIGYNTLSTSKVEEGGLEVKKEVSPYIITPEEFGEMDDFETESLTYFADGIVTDDNYNLIEDNEIEEIIGLDSLKHFGEYEDDSVFVRNENMSTDYEILLDTRNFSDLGND